MSRGPVKWGWGAPSEPGVSCFARTNTLHNFDGSTASVCHLGCLGPFFYRPVSAPPSSGQRAVTFIPMTTPKLNCFHKLLMYKCCMLGRVGEPGANSLCNFIPYRLIPQASATCLGRGHWDAQLKLIRRFEGEFAPDEGKPLYVLDWDPPLRGFESRLYTTWVLLFEKIQRRDLDDRQTITLGRYMLTLNHVMHVSFNTDRALIYPV